MPFDYRRDVKVALLRAEGSWREINIDNVADNIKKLQDYIK